MNDFHISRVCLQSKFGGLVIHRTVDFYCNKLNKWPPIQLDTLKVSTFLEFMCNPNLMNKLLVGQFGTHSIIDPKIYREKFV